MTKFEVGKSYTHTVLVKDSNGNKSTRTEIYTITKRTPCYVTFYHIAWSGSKMPHGRCKILTAEPFGEYIHLGVLSGYLYAENIVNDYSQPEAAELPATAEITQATDNDNATASQPAIVETPHSKTAKFIPGNLYYIDVDAKRSVKIIARTEKTVTFWNDIEKKETRAKIHTDSCGEFFFPYGRYSCAPEIHAFRNQEYVDNYKREAEIATSQPVVVYSPAIDEAEYTVTYDCTAPSQPEQPAIIATAHSETNSQHEIVKFEVGKTYQNDSPDFCYGAYYTITGKSRQFVSFESYFLRKQAYKKLRIGTDRNGILCEYFDDKEKGSPYPAQMVYATALAPDIPNNEDTPVTAATPQTESAPAIIYGMCDVEKALRRIKSSRKKSKSQHTPAEITQPDNLYDDGSFSDAPGDNSCPDMDIPECREPDSIPADNPGFTVVPSEHITRPDYTVYSDSIHDDIPYVTVLACETPKNSSRREITAAKCRWASEMIAILIFLWRIVIPLMFMRKFDSRRENTTPFAFSVGYKYPAYFHDKKQLLTVNERTTDKFGFSWLSVSDEDNISYRVRVKLRDDRYTELLDFKELERTCYAFDGLKPVKESNRVKYIKFQIGKSYTAVDDSYGHHERHITVLDRLVAVRNNFKDKIVYLKVRMSDSELPNEAVDGWISVWVDRKIHAEHYASTPYLHFRANQPDTVQPVIAEINNITQEPKPQPKSRKPESDSDIEHKLIDTKDLHFSELRNALDHNAAVISSCLFHEAIVSMLLKISPAAIIQLGFHMGLFIAKPKGKKIAIAEAFAKRLIERRDLHAVKSASVHSHTAKQTSINTANIPDSVKFFETKHGQLAFMFTD